MSPTSHLPDSMWEMGCKHSQSPFFFTSQVGCGKISIPDILDREVGSLKVGSGTQTRIPVLKIFYSCLIVCWSWCEGIHTFCYDLNSYETDIKPSFAENPENCVTVKSLDPEIGLKCIFPFTLSNGKTYNECTAFAWRGYIGYDAPRCSTKVDDDGVHIENFNYTHYLMNWGECSDDCPVEGKNQFNHFVSFGTVGTF